MRSSAPSAERYGAWGWRWKRLKIAPSRLDRAHAEKKAVAQQAAAGVAAGGEVWFWDGTILRGFPPQLEAWAKQGKQQIVLTSGRDAPA